MRERCVLTTLQEIITASDNLYADSPEEKWWRGHSSATFSLRPSIYRVDGGRRAEQNLAQRFRQYTPTRHNNCPPQEDFVSWLFLMQHYGLPTRLLDWSGSVLVATYFTVSELPREDGLLYALNPRELNLAENKDKTLIPTTSSPARERFNAAFDDKMRAKGILAILTHEVDNRMLLQQASFTIHGTSEPLNKHTDVARFLKKFEIPALAKPRIKVQLHAIGIRRSTLFPDLENLTSDLKELRFFV